MVQFPPYFPLFVAIFGEEKGLQFSIYTTIILTFTGILTFLFWLVRKCCPSFEELKKRDYEEEEEDEVEDSPFMHTRSHAQDIKKRLTSTNM